MLSIPPATMISPSPALMIWAAKLMARRLPPHALLIVNCGISIGIPALSATALEEFAGRSPVLKPWAMITSSISSPLRPALFIASAMTIVPRSQSLTSLKLPPNLPMGSLAALTMTTSFNLYPSFLKYSLIPPLIPSWTFQKRRTTPCLLMQVFSLAPSP